MLLLCNMRHDKTKIFDLRRSGSSYREIQKLYDISRSTLCEWFRNEEWSKHVKYANIKNQLIFSTELLAKLNKGRKDSLDKKYKEVEIKAKEEFELYKEKPLFMAGLMLYAGEGDKMTRGVIRLANTDFAIHKVFINFVIRFMGVTMENIKCSILLYPDLDIETCKVKWSQELGISLINFHKPQVIQGRHMTKRLHFGVGSTILISSFLKKKLILWVDLAKEDLAK